MQYAVKMTMHAIVQVQETIAYISKILLAPKAASAWADCLEKEIAGLGTMPARFSAVNEEPWKSIGYRIKRNAGIITTDPS